MAFVFEKVPEEDWEFFRSMDLKDCWGTKPLNLSKHTTWCADRKRNAYLVGVGGGYREMPNYYDLWWNGYTIRMEVSEGGAEAMTQRSILFGIFGRSLFQRKYGIKRTK